MQRLHLILALISSLSLGAQFHPHRPNLVVFSGSDWCLPCMSFEKNVLSNELFKRYAQRNLLLIKADFPQHNRQSDSLRSFNEQLADRYNPEGAFPKIILLDAGGLNPRSISYQASAEQFIATLEDALPAMQEFERVERLMGTRFEFNILSRYPSSAHFLLDKCVEKVAKIEASISSWQPGSQLSEVNRQAGRQAVVVSPELKELLLRCKKLSQMTQGAFDITFAGVSFYRFEGQEQDSLPQAEYLRPYLQKVGMKHLHLDSVGVFLDAEGARIGLGAVGKGYAADEVKKMLIDLGVQAAVINASGDLTTLGENLAGEPWKIGIAHPSSTTEALFWLPSREAAVATSGSAEKFFTYAGKRYSHILDPRSGLPVSDKLSTTVISPSAELSDALATAIFVLSTEQGLALINKLPNTECIIIDAAKEVHFSNGLQYLDAPDP